MSQSVRKGSRVLMIEDAINTELQLLRTKLDSLSQNLNELHLDIQFIKEIFLAKQAKKERRRQKKEQERLDIERKKKDQENRSTYEDIVWKIRRRRLWDLWPAPTSGLTATELQLVSLLAQHRTDQEIALRMNLKDVGARVCAANKKLGLKNRQDLINYYLKHKSNFREHQHRKCIALLSWLLDPPPGMIYRRNLKLTWKRIFGRGRIFHYAGPYIPPSVFDRLREYEHAVLRLKMRGVDNASIAERLKIKETTIQSYFSRFRATIKMVSGVTVTSEEQLMGVYKEHLKTGTQKKPAKVR